MYVIKFRRDTSTRFYRLNPLLMEGEPAYETNTGRVKIGDGSTLWRDLGYFGGDGESSALLEHIDDPTPHPAYDDGPSLSLLYENAKV